MIDELFYMLYLVQDDVERCETSEYAVDYSKEVTSIQGELVYEKDSLSIVENIPLEEFIYSAELLMRNLEDSTNC